MPSFVTKVQTLSSPGSAFSGAGEGNSDTIDYGRVVDVIVDSSHPRYKQMGGTQALYGVFYQPLLERQAEDLGDEKAYLRFAYCKQNSLRQIPIKNEIVTLEVGLSAFGVEDRDSNVDQRKVYWTSIVPVWNHPHLNIYPDTWKMEHKGQKEADLGPSFQENMNIKPLQLNAGDVVLEGRHGQSLRFGGTCSVPNDVSTKETNGQPYTILRNGQATVKSSTCVEDVNKDDSSLYLTSDHKVPVIEANRKFAGAVSVPELAKDYKGKQIVINSDRVTVNAREENLAFAAKKHASINADTTSIDGEKYVGIDGRKVYLGEASKLEREPVLKGQTTVDLMKDLWNAVVTFLSCIQTKPSTPWETNTNVQAIVAAKSILATLARIDSTKSKKVFTE